MMTDRVYARALTLAEDPGSRERELLEILCESAFASLAARLREGMLPEDCGECFVTAAAMEAVAALESFGETAEFKAGDLTVKMKQTQGKAAGLRHQAEQLMGPYLKDRFLFAGV